LTDFGRLRRRAGARAFFSSPLLRYGSSERDDGRDGRKPMNTKIMCRRLVDPPRFHLANDRQLFAASSLATLIVSRATNDEGPISDHFRLLTLICASGFAG
jgi:hypothetical protein